jgi:hypothetical protein
MTVTVVSNGCHCFFTALPICNIPKKGIPLVKFI